MGIDLEFVSRIDTELVKLEVPLHARPFQVVRAWLQMQGGGLLMAPELWEPVEAAYKLLYPSGNFGIPPLLIGGVSFRDQMYLAHVTIAFGTIKIEPLKCIDISTRELEIIWKQRPEEIVRASYSVADLWDIAYGVEDLQGQTSEATFLWRNACSAITTTAKILQTSFNPEIAIQNACLVAELSLKGTLAFLGWSEPRRRKLDHRLSDLANAVIAERPTSDDARLQRACDSFPDGPKSRYRSAGLRRSELLILALRAQYVAAEALRRVSRRNLAKKIEQGPNALPRQDI